jgi:GlpG protein
MRELNTFDEKKHAMNLSNLLLVKGIDSRVTGEDSGPFILWVIEEEKMDEAETIMEEFLKNPENVEYRSFARKAEEIRFEEEQEDKRYRKMMEDSKVQWKNFQSARMGPVTMVLIVASAAVFLLSGFGQNTTSKIFQFLTITQYEISYNMIRWLPGLPEIFHGQVWRLITPIILHFNFLHILFNMLWLRMLGNEIENRSSSKYLAFLIIYIAVFSNVGQYLVSGPSFGGMSGVVYGLLGFIWIRGKFDPASGYYLDRTIVIFMMAWFVICLTGLVGSIANMTHAVGLACGVLWGYFSAKNANIRREM